VPVLCAQGNSEELGIDLTVLDRRAALSLVFRVFGAPFAFRFGVRAISEMWSATKAGCFGQGQEYNESPSRRHTGLRETEFDSFKLQKISEFSSGGCSLRASN
jgi:hypothetical protein